MTTKRLSSAQIRALEIAAQHPDGFVLERRAGYKNKNRCATSTLSSLYHREPMLLRTLNYSRYEITAAGRAALAQHNALLYAKQIVESIRDDGTP